MGCSESLACLAWQVTNYMRWHVIRVRTSNAKITSNDADWSHQMLSVVSGSTVSDWPAGLSRHRQFPPPF